MKRTILDVGPGGAVRLLLAALASLPGLLAQESVPAKTLPVPGEVFEVRGCAAFLIRPADARNAESSGGTPWVFYAPTLKGLPSKAETWMFGRLLAAGVAIAGIDVGESYGSPAGRALYQALYDELTKRRGFARRACLLARSRGGLMLYGWAAEHPDAVAGIAGIYPVCNLVSYPGIERACGAFGMTPGELRGALSDHNPIERLAPLAHAAVPIFHLHGDRDHIVPLAPNSALVHERYLRLGGAMRLETVAGRGHDMWRGWFQSAALTDFVIEHARGRNGRTAGRIDFAAAGPPRGAVRLVGPERSILVPEKAEVPCRWRFADGVLTASPQWDSVITPTPYADFRLHVEFNVNAGDSDNPEANGNSGIYIQQRYEVQILDSHGVAAADYKASYCGSLYRLRQPDRIACLPAGEWQTFDIVFRAARYDGDQKVQNARITVYQNRQLLHDDVELPRKTGAGKPEGPEPRPIKLQGHHNEVRFRNVWVLPLELD
ncbi:MAG: DUF1080 domain-containing protein [bacterium]|nr:DUF1080 domain-containing protein [bacterium]